MRRFSVRLLGGAPGGGDQRVDVDRIRRWTDGVVSEISFPIDPNSRALAESFDQVRLVAGGRPPARALSNLLYFALQREVIVNKLYTDRYLNGIFSAQTPVDSRIGLFALGIVGFDEGFHAWSLLDALDAGIKRALAQRLGELAAYAVGQAVGKDAARALFALKLGKIVKPVQDVTSRAPFRHCMVPDIALYPAGTIDAFEEINAAVPVAERAVPVSLLSAQLEVAAAVNYAAMDDLVGEISTLSAITQLVRDKRRGAAGRDISRSIREARNAATDTDVPDPDTLIGIKESEELHGAMFHTLGERLAGASATLGRDLGRVSERYVPPEYRQKPPRLSSPAEGVDEYSSWRDAGERVRAALTAAGNPSTCFWLGGRVTRSMVNGLGLSVKVAIVSAEIATDTVPFIQEGGSSSLLLPRPWVEAAYRVLACTEGYRAAPCLEAFADMCQIRPRNGLDNATEPVPRELLHFAAMGALERFAPNLCVSVGDRYVVAEDIIWCDQYVSKDEGALLKYARYWFGR